MTIYITELITGLLATVALFIGCLAAARSAA